MCHECKVYSNQHSLLHKIWFVRLKVHFPYIVLQWACFEFLEQTHISVDECEWPRAHIKLNIWDLLESCHYFVILFQDLCFHIKTLFIHHQVISLFADTTSLSFTLFSLVASIHKLLQTVQYSAFGLLCPLVWPPFHINTHSHRQTDRQRNENCTHGT